MENSLSQLLQKRGIKDYTELDPEERAQFDIWRKILSKDELTMSDFREFCEQQLTLIGLQFEDSALEQRKQDKLVAQFAVYTAIKRAIDAPKLEKEQIEKYLRTLIKE